MDFETALREQLETQPRGRIRGKRLLKILDSKPSKRRTRILARLEAHARTHLVSEGVVGADAVGFDWSSVDWQKVFDVILKILLALLPFLLALSMLVLLVPMWLLMC